MFLPGNCSGDQSERWRSLPARCPQGKPVPWYYFRYTGHGCPGCRGSRIEWTDTEVFTSWRCLDCGTAEAHMKTLDHVEDDQQEGA